MKTTHNVPLKALCLTLGVHFKVAAPRKYKQKNRFLFCISLGLHYLCNCLAKNIE